MKKTFIALLALAGVAAAADYTYVGSVDGWAEAASNWQDAGGNLLGSSGLLNASANSGKISGSTFTIADTQSVKAGHNTGGFNGATVNIEQGGTLKIDNPYAVYGTNTEVNVYGTLVVNSGQTLGTTGNEGAATVNVRNGGVLQSIGKIEKTNVVVASGGELRINSDTTHIGAANITLERGATFTGHDDLKLKGTTFTLKETLTLGTTYLDANTNTGSATFNLKGGNTRVEFAALSLNSGTWGSNTYTFSADSNEGYGCTLSDDTVGLFTRTLMTYGSLNSGVGSTEADFLSHIRGGEFTLLDGITMTQREGNAAFDEAALTGADVGQYRFLIEDKALKVQYAAYLVPEPTTATLSLLALAGLAARRRRR